jgi:hypothetical protein
MRVGNSERDRALDALGDHMRAGRLTPDEYSARSSRVISATTNADLNSVFMDLPGGFGALGATPPGPSSAVAPAPSGYPSAAPSYPPPSYEHPDRVARPAAAAPAPAARRFDYGRLMAIAGPHSRILFFVCGFAFGGWAWSWLFFLLPGLLGAWGGGRR